MTITLHRPTAQAAADWPPCPTWCAGGDDCYGGDTFDFGDSRTVTTNRMHTGTLADITTDVFDGAPPQRLRLLAERCDDPTSGPGHVRVRLVVGTDSPDPIADPRGPQTAWITPDAAAALVAALTGAV